ncbi:MAG TPA: DUF1553 domain-containing protein, partial [Planctomycetia bacterium]|nr:DUF1553 domain-containing protein [Planctomycetia bacterium]
GCTTPTRIVGAAARARVTCPMRTCDQPITASITAAATAPTAEPLPPAVQSALATPAAQRSEAATATVFSHWRKTVADFKQADAAIEALWKQWPAGSTALTLASREMPRDTRLLKRGDFLKPANTVGAGVPAALHSLKDPNAPATRLTFAEWLVDPRSPTTARVLVNRVWQQYFGIGLVTSAEDFGTQSDAPSHPELLDWLATELMANGWSVKHLHRLIVGSATYRQSSRIDPAASAADPYNRLLARFPRQRVEGEIVRDIALAASGRLDPKVGGPAIFSPAPAFLFQPPASYGPFVWTQAKGSDRYRRGLYTFRRRSTPYPMLTNFDSPNGDASCVRRVRSNTPLQALTTLNEEVFLECAQGLAEKTLKEGGKTDEERLRYAFRRCVARPPAAEDLADLQSLLDKQRARIKAGKMNASLVATGVKDAKPRSDGVAYPELAAYVVVARALLNLDETIARE